MRVPAEGRPLQPSLLLRPAPCAAGFGLQFEHPTLAGPTPGGWMNRADAPAAAAALVPSSGPATPGSRSAQLYSMEEVEQHTTKDSCWFVVEGKVYDATPFLKEHPGAALCGRRSPGRPAAPPQAPTALWRPCPPTHPPTRTLLPPPAACSGGADSILLVAGTDATDEFNAIHSAKAKAMLKVRREGGGEI